MPHTHDEVSERFRRAQYLAERSGSRITEAIVALDFARAQAYFIGNQAFLTPVAADAESVRSGIGLALWAGGVFGDHGMARNVVLAYMVAAEVALAAGDLPSRDTFCSEAYRLAVELGLDDLQATVQRIWHQDSPHDMAMKAVRPLDQWTESEREHLVEESVRISGATPEQASVGRGILKQIIDDDAVVSKLRTSVCRHICLLSDLGVPSIGALPLERPMRYAVCRLRGSNYLAHSSNDRNVAEAFVRDVCAQCPEPNPGVTPDDITIRAGESIYGPLEARIQAEAHTT